MVENHLKKKLRDGCAAAGIFMTCDASDFVEIAALSGFDFVILDSGMEQSALQLCRI